MAKAVRMSDIAERLHVSIVTVSKALAGKDGVSEELRQEILQLAEEMGYQSKKFKPAATGKTYTLGIVTSYRYIEKGQSFYWNLYERILFYLAQTGHIGILEVVTDSAEQERQIPRLVQEERVDGVIVMGNFSKSYREMLAETGIPLVVLDAFDARYHRDSVISDGYYGMYTMVDYLLQMGHRNIMFVGSVNATSSITDRYYGYCRAMREAGVSVTEDYVLPDRDAEGKVTISLEHLKKMPSAFACNCDITAYTLLNALKEQGVRVPEDVSVVGFDDYILAGLAVPPLTTYAVDVDHMAKVSAQQLIRRIQKERGISVIYITHDLGVVAKVADYVDVMYAGKIVETGTIDEIFYDPKHPYTWGLLSAMPDLDTADDRLYTIPGSPPNLLHEKPGDAFAPRNRFALNIDDEIDPPMFKISDTHYAATWLLDPRAPKVEMPPELKERIARMKAEAKKIEEAE